MNRRIVKNNHAELSCLGVVLDDKSSFREASVDFIAATLNLPEATVEYLVSNIKN